MPATKEMSAAWRAQRILKEKQILFFLLDHSQTHPEPPTAQQIADHIGFSRTRAGLLLASLQEKKHLSHIKGANGDYRLTEQGLKLISSIRFEDYKSKQEDLKNAAQQDKNDDLKAKFFMAVMDKDYKAVKEYLSKQLKYQQPDTKRMILELAFSIVAVSKDKQTARMLYEHKGAAKMHINDFIHIARKFGADDYFAKLSSPKF